MITSRNCFGSFFAIFHISICLVIITISTLVPRSCTIVLIFESRSRKWTPNWERAGYWWLWQGLFLYGSQSKFSAVLGSDPVFQGQHTSTLTSQDEADLTTESLLQACCSFQSRGLAHGCSAMAEMGALLNSVWSIMRWFKSEIPWFPVLSISRARASTGRSWSQLPGRAAIAIRCYIYLKGLPLVFKDVSSTARLERISRDRGAFCEIVIPRLDEISMYLNVLPMPMPMPKAKEDSKQHIFVAISEYCHKHLWGD